MGSPGIRFGYWAANSALFSCLLAGTDEVILD